MTTSERMNAIERFDIQTKIVNRAEKLGLLMFDRISAYMDLDSAFCEWDIDCEEWINADNINFAHDFIGIQESIDRRTFSYETMTCKFDGLFIPRFAK